MRTPALSLGLLALVLSMSGCGGEPDPQAETDDTSSGDGDGDPSAGDGDGDPSTGDGDGDPSTGDGDGDPSAGDGDGDANPGDPLLTDMRMFIFGHSLINHELTDNPPPSNELSVPHWTYLLAQDASYQYAVSGQYGFLPQHANLPPIAQWGFDIVPPAWDSDLEPFVDADFTTVMITAGNFIQYKGPEEPYDGENPDNLTPVGTTTTIVDWVREQEPGVRVYIYENWPDMAGLIAGFPPTPAELDAYHAHTQTDFHAWWLDYQDALLAARPQADVRMIPVGPTLARLLTDTPLAGIPLDDLYEDDAPHGRPTIYFLAGLVTYMGTYGVRAPEGFELPPLVHALVADNYDTVVDVVWEELEGFTDDEGVSRVW